MKELGCQKGIIRFLKNYFQNSNPWHPFKTGKLCYFVAQTFSADAQIDFRTPVFGGDMLEPRMQ